MFDEYGGVLAGVLGTIVTVFGAWFGILRKSKTDEASIALEAWKELVSPMKKQIEDLHVEVAELKGQLAEAEVRHTKERKSLLKRIGELENK